MLQVDTIGDAYMCTSGIVAPDADGFLAIDTQHDPCIGAQHMVALAEEMIQTASTVSALLLFGP